MADKSGNATVESALVPAARWAQRKDKVFLTFAVENCKTPIVQFAENSVHFKGMGGPENKAYEVICTLYGDIQPDESRFSVHGRDVICVIKKKESSTGYWPRLLKDAKKAHYLKTDFERWRDEDDSDQDDEDEYSLDDMMKNMGGLDHMSAPPDEGEDSDDEDMPDLQ